MDRAGNVGPIKDYGFTAGNRDYNRAQKVDIKLPVLDTASPDPVLTDTPQPPPAHPEDGRIAWKGWETRTFDSGGTRVTVTPLQERSLEGTREAAKEAAKQDKTRAPSYPDPIIKGDWCQPSFEVAFQVKTDPKNGDVKTWIQINPIFSDFPGHDESVLLGAGSADAYIDSMCFSPACEGAVDSKDVRSFDFYNDLSWKGGGDSQPVDSHMATGSASHKWDGSVNSATGSRDIDLSRGLPVWFIGQFDTYYEPAEGKKDDTIHTPFRSPRIDVRCDKVTAKALTPAVSCRSTFLSTSSTPPSTRRRPRTPG